MSDWRDEAACRGTDTDVFFTPASERDAVRVCAGCTVTSQCANDALHHEERYGVWGGTTPDQREVLRRKVAS